MNRYEESFERLDNALKDYVTDFPVTIGKDDYTAAPGTPIGDLRGKNYDLALDNAVSRVLEDYAEALYELCGGPDPKWIRDTILKLADDSVDTWRQTR
jgi:hypothetical protein